MPLSQNHGKCAAPAVARLFRAHMGHICILALLATNASKGSASPVRHVAFADGYLGDRFDWGRENGTDILYGDDEGTGSVHIRQIGVSVGENPLANGEPVYYIGQETGWEQYEKGTLPGT